MSVQELVLSSGPVPLDRETETRTPTAPPAYQWRPVEDPPAPPRPRGFIAHLTGFFVAYHTA